MQEELILNRKEMPYIPEFSVGTKFFSTSPLNELYNTLAMFLANITSEIFFGLSDYSAEAKIVYDSSENVSLLFIFRRKKR